jgi:hypothetical protein
MSTVSFVRHEDFLPRPAQVNFSPSLFSTSVKKSKQSVIFYGFTDFTVAKLPRDLSLC